MFTPQPELAVKEMLIRVLSLGNTNTDFPPPSVNSALRSKRGGIKSLAGLILLFLLFQNQQNQSARGMSKGVRRDLQTHINTGRRAQSQTHSNAVA